MDREPYLTKEKVNEILNYAELSNFRDYLILRLLWVTGIRVSECLGIRPRDIYYDIRAINVKNLKHEGYRLVFFDENTEDELKRFIDNLGIELNDLLFTIRRTQVWNLVKKYGRLAGVNISAHTFRHSFATFAEESGLKFNTVQRLLGHNSVYSSTQIYLHAGGTELQKEYFKLNFE